MEQAIKAGISGFVIAVVITLFSTVDLYFIPQLVASIIVIYIFDIRTTKDGLLAAFITYLFSIGILGSVSLAFYLVSNEPVNLTIDIWLVLNQIVTPLTALPAALAGVWLAKTRRPTARTPPPPPPIPPV